MSFRFQKRTKFRPQLRHPLSLWVSYLLLSIILTWPTVSQMATHLPGDGGDDPAIAWNLWWVKYALLNAGQNPFQTDFMFYPIGVNLAFYTLTVLNALIALPFTLNFGVTTASNLHLFFSFAAGGYGAFLLVRYILTMTLMAGRRRESQINETAPGPSLADQEQRLIWLCAAVAGGFYAFASNKLFYVALGQFNIASTHWIPFVVLYLLRAHYQPYRLKNPLMAGLFLTLQAWTEMTYASFLLIFMGLYWLFWGVLSIPEILRDMIKYTLKSLRIHIPSLMLHLRLIAVTGLTFGLGISPILAQMLPDMQVEGDFLVEGTGFAQTFSADLFGFLIPTMHHPLLGNLVEQTGIADFDKGQHIYIGLVLPGLALAGLFAAYRRPAVQFWLIAAAAFALLCLGPVITLNGQTTSLEGPFTLVQSLPFFKGNRYPSRYSVMLILSLSVLAGFGLVKIGDWLKKAGRPTPGIWQAVPIFFIGGLFLLEHLALPLPQSDMRPPPAYQIIAADPDNFTVLDIPFAWRNGFRITGAQTTQFMFGQFYQTKHQKRLLQGNTSRNPEFKFQYFTGAPVINSLLALETGKVLPPERWEQDRAIAPDVLRFFDIKYIVIRPFSYSWYDGANSVEVNQEAVTRYVEEVFPIEKIYDEAAVKIYRVRSVSDWPANLQIQSDHPLAPLFFGEGWGWLTPGRPVSAQREEVRLLLPLAATAQEIRLRIRLPEAGPDNAGLVYATLNGWQSAPQAIGTEWREISFEPPSEVMQTGLNDVRLHFDWVAALPSSFEEADAPIFDVTVLSAGEEVGGFGHIFVNGYEISPNQRGYNVAVIRPGMAPAEINFDTHHDSAASLALSQYFPVSTSDDPDHMLVAVAAADEASANLSEEAVQALQAIGARQDMRGCFRCSHALISEVGKPDGRVIEALDPLRPVGVTTGLGLTEPRLAAVVDWIQIR